MNNKKYASNKLQYKQANESVLNYKHIAMFAKLQCDILLDDAWGSYPHYYLSLYPRRYGIYS